MPSVYPHMLAHGIAWVLPLATLIFGVRRFEPIFGDFGIPLPNLTIWAIQAAHWPSIFVSVIVLLLIADRFVLTAMLQRRDFQDLRTWSALMITTPLLMAAVALGSLFLPMVNVMTHLSG